MQQRFPVPRNPVQEGKKQPGGPGRSGEQRSKRTLEEVAELEGSTPAKQTRKSTRTTKSRTGKGKKSK